MNYLALDILLCTAIAVFIIGAIATTRELPLLTGPVRGRLDPVIHCKVYNLDGCAHVDGPDCDMETCRIRVIVSAIVTPNDEKIIATDRGGKLSPDRFKRAFAGE